MAKICFKCKKPAITYIRYNGTHLCKDHFNEYFEKRVKKDIKKQGKTKTGAKIGVAVSGGKDSLVALKLIDKIFSKRKNIELVVITVDEGIKGYRDKSIRYVEKFCEEINVSYEIVSFEKMIGMTLDQITDKNIDLGECSYCGVFRRFCLNKTAKKLNVDKLVFGHNLDDMAQSILMNFSNGDVQKLARLGPHKKVQRGLVPRMLPLRTIPEKENTLYAIINNIDFYDGECPYAINALRGVYRDIVDDLEYRNPGTRHSILNSYESLKDCLVEKFPPVDLDICPSCGEPTSQNKCKTCILKENLSKK